jgi:hypothetical protein
MVGCRSAELAWQKPYISYQDSWTTSVNSSYVEVSRNAEYIELDATSSPEGYLASKCLPQLRSGVICQCRRHASTIQNRHRENNLHFS